MGGGGGGGGGGVKLVSCTVFHSKKHVCSEKNKSAIIVNALGPLPTLASSTRGFQLPMPTLASNRIVIDWHQSPNKLG